MSIKNEKYDYRSDSIAWKPSLNKKGKPMLDNTGKPMYETVSVPQREKGYIFCPYCDKYIKLEKFDLGRGLLMKGCRECGITTRDFHMKRVNTFLK